VILEIGAPGSPRSDQMIDMATEKSTARDAKLSTDLKDRERMTEKALAAIRRTRPAAALERCSRLADQIEAALSQRQLKDSIESFLQWQTFRHFLSVLRRS
jgi:hypothetical protein